MSEAAAGVGVEAGAGAGAGDAPVVAPAESGDSAAGGGAAAGGGDVGDGQAAARRKRGRSLAVAGFVGSALFGGVVGFGVQTGLESTGMFGTTLDAVAAEQRENFDKIRAKLDEIGKATPGSPEAARLQRELAGLVSQQEKLAGRTGDELKAAQAEVTRLRDEVLKKNGTASGADIWLLKNEAVDVQRRGIVLALVNVRASGAYVDINLSGKPHSLKPGEAVEFKDGGVTCKVIYKAAIPRSDGRYGFDFVREP